MNYYGIFLIFLAVFSLYFTYRITKKIASKREKGKLWESVVLFLFTFLIVGSLSLFSLFFSYTFIWEKGFRAVIEQKHEAIVVDYVVEKSYRKSTTGSGSYPILLYFPVVKFKNENGIEIKKKLDLTSNHPYQIGEIIKISADDSSQNANSIEFEPLMSIIAISLTSVAMFFFVLVASYGFDKTMKERVKLSRNLSILLVVINVIITIWMYFVV